MGTVGCPVAIRNCPILVKIRTYLICTKFWSGMHESYSESDCYNRALDAGRPPSSPRMPQFPKTLQNHIKKKKT